MLLLFVIVFVC